MSKVLVKELECQKENVDKNEIKQDKPKLTFLKIVQYFVLYSFIGLILETMFGLLVEGVVESRKNFLYGPFSCIYGVGGVLMLLTLSRFSKNRYTIFLGGAIVGTLLEYCISLFGELIYGVKWWDYSYLPFNINGRVCLIFSLMWGLLGVYFVSHFQPKVDKFLNKINKKFLDVTTVIMVIFLILNFIVTSFALQVFYTKIANEHDLEFKDKSQILTEYDKWYENDTFRYVADNIFSNEKMVRTFPNLRIMLEDGTLIYTRDLYPDIQPYYFKVFDIAQ